MKTKSQTIMRNLAFLLVLMLSLSAKAQVEFLIVNLSDGSTSSFALADHPIVKTLNGQFTVESENIDLSVPISELNSFHFSSDLSGIDEMLTKASHFIDKDHIIFNGIKEGNSISIFSVNGTLMAHAAADSDGNADINISNFPTSIYVVSTSSSTFKFIKK